ncbi:MAG: hypothetical protein HRU40_12425 [Saprospiraceae bacterium]|nr:hypothetical protein [Saprospiraceae bacterium]
MKRFIFFYLFLIIQLSVYGQRRRVVTRPLSPVVHSTEQAASDQVLYMPLQALKMAIPLETHEHNHDHGNHTTVSVTSMRTRTARNLPKPSALWNHPSYVNSVNRLVG